MDIDPRYLKSELLHILLFTSKNLAISNYCDLNKIKPLLDIIPFEVEIIDFNELVSEDILEIYLNQLEMENGNAYEKFRPILVIQNPTVGSLKKLFSIPWLKWITILNSDSRLINTIKDAQESDTIIYNAKLEQLEPDVKDGINLVWEDTIMSHIADCSDLDDAISRTKLLTNGFYNIAKSLSGYIINNDRDKIRNSIKNIMHSDAEITLYNIQQFLTHYFGLNIDLEDYGIDIGSEQVKRDVDHRPLGMDRDITTDVSEIEPILNEQIQDLESETIELEYIANSAKAEFLCIKNSNRQLFKSFIGLLFDERKQIKNPYIHKNHINPIDLYTELRFGPWNEHISESFLIKWFLIHLKRLSKQKKINPNDKMLINELEVFNKILGSLPVESELSFVKIKNKMVLIERSDFLSDFKVDCKDRGQNNFNQETIANETADQILDKTRYQKLDSHENQKHRDFLLNCIKKQKIENIALFTESVVKMLKIRK